MIEMVDVLFFVYGFGAFLSFGWTYLVQVRNDFQHMIGEAILWPFFVLKFLLVAIFMAVDNLILGEPQ